MHLPWLSVIFLICFYVLTPLIRPGFFVSDDGDWMIIRLSAFYQSLREGQFPVRFLGRLNFDYGYPVAVFLYPGFMYLGSIIHFLGFSFSDSIKIIIAICVLGTGAVLYLFLSKYFSRLASFCGAASSIMAPYLLFDIYKRGSIGEILAIFMGVLAFTALDRRYIVTGIFALCGLILSHNTIALLFMILIFAFILFRRTWSDLILVSLSLGISAFFWIPALYERAYIIFDNTVISNPFEFFAVGENLVLLGYLPLVCLAVILTNFRKIRNGRPLLVFMTVVYAGVIFFASPLSAPLWTIRNFGMFIQFPYRFLTLNTLIGAYLVSNVVNALSEKKSVIFSVVALIYLFINAYGQLARIEYSDKPDSFYYTNEATTTVADEYMPRWVKYKPTMHATQKAAFFTGSGEIKVKETLSHKITLDVVAREPSIIRINKIYYPGWGVLVNGVPGKIDYDNDQGLIHVKVPTGKFEIYAEFRENLFRFIADIISLISLILMVFYLRRKYD